MNGLRFVLLFVLKAVLADTNRNDLDKGYYWRGYHGVIPEDAFVAATNNGENLYVGQTIHGGDRTFPVYERGPKQSPVSSRTLAELQLGTVNPYAMSTCETRIVLTGQIEERSHEMTYEWGLRRNVAGGNVQILCTNHPEYFQWVEANATTVEDLDNSDWVSGGVEQRYTLYVGRAKVEDEMTIGKVVITDKHHRLGFFGTPNNSYVRIESDFEILSFGPTENKT